MKSIINIKNGKTKNKIVSNLIVTVLNIPLIINRAEINFSSLNTEEINS